MAAVLACGDGAVLSHRSAAALWGVRSASRRAIDVSARGRRGRSRTGISAHRGDSLTPDEVTTARGIPCTTVARTLLDLAEVSGRHTVARAVDQAEVLQIFDGRALDDVLKRANGRSGAAMLEAILADHEIASGMTRSELEKRFLELCTRHGIPLPVVNSRVAVGKLDLEVDFAWPRKRLIVEADGHRFHATRGAFERDRRRDQRLTLAGWRVVRCTWRQVIGDPGTLARTILALLRRGGLGR
jgi:Protein of unknown function (DUF559)